MRRKRNKKKLKQLFRSTLVKPKQRKLTSSKRWMSISNFKNRLKRNKTIIKVKSLNLRSSLRIMKLLWMNTRNKVKNSLNKYKILRITSKTQKKKMRDKSLSSSKKTMTSYSKSPILKQLLSK